MFITTLEVVAISMFSTNPWLKSIETTSFWVVVILVNANQASRNPGLDVKLLICF